MTEDEKKAEARKLRDTGMPIRKIAAVLCVRYETARFWLEYEAEAKPALKGKSKSGSGVIAPKAYAYGYRWHGGRVQGW